MFARPVLLPANNVRQPMEGFHPHVNSASLLIAPIVMEIIQFAPVVIQDIIRAEEGVINVRLTVLLVSQIHNALHALQEHICKQMVAAKRYRPTVSALTRLLSSLMLVLAKDVLLVTFCYKEIVILVE
jgi:hypothetical protein